MEAQNAQDVCRVPKFGVWMSRRMYLLYIAAILNSRAANNNQCPITMRPYHRPQVEDLSLSSYLT